MHRCPPGRKAAWCCANVAAPNGMGAAVLDGPVGLVDVAVEVNPWKAASWGCCPRPLAGAGGDGHCGLGPRLALKAELSCKWAYRLIPKRLQVTWTMKFPFQAR